MDNIKKILDAELEKMGLFVDTITYKDKRLEIVVDSNDKIVDLDTVVKATNVISPLLDEHDFIKESYVLDVSSKEKGGN